MIKNFSDISAKKNYDLIGGKAANLNELIRLGLNVPKCFIISTEVSESFFEICFNTLEKQINKDEYLKSMLNQKSLEANIVSVSRLILNTPLPLYMEKTICDFFGDLNSEFVSVRSSAVMEDSKNNSFAGIYDSFLNVNRTNLINTIKRCWCSLFSKRAIQYYLRNQILTTDIKLAVIIQEMVDPDVSGVCFTSNPVTGNFNEIYIEAIYGLGEGIVGGKITPDSYLYSIESRQIEKKTINEQRYKINVTAFETLEVEVNKDLIYCQKISDEIILTLANYCIEIQKHFKIPQDIEFAVKGDLIYFLQSRPITT